eukprot:gene15806-18743_t
MAANSGQRTTAVNSGQRKTAANGGQQRPITVNSGQRTTAVNSGQRTTAVNNGQQRDDETEKAIMGPTNMGISHRVLLFTCRESFFQFRTDFAVLLGVHDVKRSLGPGMWKHAKLLDLQADSMPPHEQGDETRADDYGTDRFLNFNRKSLLSQATGGVTSAGEAAISKRLARLTSQTTELQDLRRQHTTSFLQVSSAEQRQHSLAWFVVAMLESGTNLPERLQADALQLLRCGVYANEPLRVVPGVGGRHARENFRRFVCGRPAVKLGATTKGCEKLLHWVQTSYATAGASRVALKYIYSPCAEVSTAARQLLIALLEGGNKEVLDLVFRDLTQRDARTIAHVERLFKFLSSSIRGLVHTAETFFKTVVQGPQRLLGRHSWMRNARSLKGLRIASEEPLPELQLVPDDLQMHIDKVKEGCELVRLLQLLTEGHHSDMQNLLHTQPHSRISVDLVTELVEVSESLQPMALESLTFGARHLGLLLLQTLHALTEFVQGPCPANVQMVSNSNLIKSLDVLISGAMLRALLDRDATQELPFFAHVASLMDQQDLWAANITGASLICCLQTSALVLVKSLFEGAKGSTVKLLMSKINIPIVTKNLYTIYDLSMWIDLASHRKDIPDEIRPLVCWEDTCPRVAEWARANKPMAAYSSTDPFLLGDDEVPGAEVSLNLARTANLMATVSYTHISLLRLLAQEEDVEHIADATNALQLMEINDPEIYTFFQSQVACVEVVFLDKVQKVYFPMPEM